MAQVVEPPLGDDLGGVDLLRAAQEMHLAEALALQMAQGPAQFALVALDDPAGQPGPVGARRIAGGADLLGYVEHDRHRQDVVLAGQPYELGPGLGLHIGGVDDGQPTGRQPLARDVVQHIERIAAGALIVLVVADQPAAEVGREDLGGPEMPCGEGGFARSGGADQHHERQIGHRERTSRPLGPYLRPRLAPLRTPAPLLVVAPTLVRRLLHVAVLDVVVVLVPVPVLVLVLLPVPVLVLVPGTVVVRHAAASFPLIAPLPLSLPLLLLLLLPLSSLLPALPLSPSRRKCASWVGGPTSGSSGPTGAKATA